MITILSTLLGFFGAAFPEILKMFTDRSDKRHELEIMKLQIQQAQAGNQQRLEEIGMQADAAFYAAAHQPQNNTGVRWVDALNATVRPVLAYAFFVLYATVKVWQFCLLPESAPDLPWLQDKSLHLLWTEEDMAIFCAIISYYFGARGLQKLRTGK